MTIYFIFLGILLCSIVLTTLQIKQQSRKEMDEIVELFEDVPET